VKPAMLTVLQAHGVIEAERECLRLNRSFQAAGVPGVFDLSWHDD